MMTLTLVTLLLTLVALSVSIFALSAVRRSSAQSLSRQLSELSTAVEDQMLSIRSLKVRVSALAKPKTPQGRFARSEDGNLASEGQQDFLDNSREERDPNAWQRELARQMAIRGSIR